MRSPVTVPTMIWSISPGDTFASARARFAASDARNDEGVFGSEMRRSRIPVRETIHSSEVSTIASRSLFVRTRLGVYDPVPMM